MSNTPANETSSHAEGEGVVARAAALRDEHYLKIAVRTDRLFGALLAGQWAFAIVLALVVSPKTWQGLTSTTHPHVFYAIGLGGLLAVPPALLAWRRPGHVVTRYAIAVAQMAFGALF